MNVYKDRNGRELKVGDRVRIQVCTGRYGQTAIRQGAIVAFSPYRAITIKTDEAYSEDCGRFGVHRREAGSHVSVNAEFDGYRKHDDFEHGHEVWTELIEPPPATTQSQGNAPGDDPLATLGAEVFGEQQYAKLKRAAAAVATTQSEGKPPRMVPVPDALAILRAALQRIADNGPKTEPEEEDYDDTESAYGNGMDVAAWEAATIARTALRNAFRRAPGPNLDPNRPKRVPSWAEKSPSCVKPECSGHGVYHGTDRLGGLAAYYRCDTCPAHWSTQRI